MEEKRKKDQERIRKRIEEVEHQEAEEQQRDYSMTPKLPALQARNFAGGHDHSMTHMSATLRTLLEDSDICLFLA
ncbi:hypothetical protein C2845_PM01G04850 [Panicum miliaceum]|uniref:Uncharacterized protein n=1 Tax=Panicum miliaceum TaxID=4540 RepID=A0A3L6TT31_PANMI|nr:hypothetical protein C2845_PM01G04850 [Panicum miliaceum]